MRDLGQVISPLRASDSLSRKQRALHRVVPRYPRKIGPRTTLPADTKIPRCSSPKGGPWYWGRRTHWHKGPTIPSSQHVFWRLNEIKNTALSRMTIPQRALNKCLLRITTDYSEIWCSQLQWNMAYRKCEWNNSDINVTNTELSSWVVETESLAKFNADCQQKRRYNRKTL